MARSFFHILPLLLVPVFLAGVAGFPAITSNSDKVVTYSFKESFTGIELSIERYHHADTKTSAEVNHVNPKASVEVNYADREASAGTSPINSKFTHKASHAEKELAMSHASANQYALQAPVDINNDIFNEIINAVQPAIDTIASLLQYVANHPYIMVAVLVPMMQWWLVIIGFEELGVAAGMVLQSTQYMGPLTNTVC